jgi:hypothetical protein
MRLTYIFHDFTMKDLSFFLDRNNLQPRSSVNSNLLAKNWIYGSLSNNDFKLQMFRNITSGRNIVKCQMDVPFFDGEKCINCTGNNPYFNIQTKKCENCSSGIEDHRCK